MNVSGYSVLVLFTLLTLFGCNQINEMEDFPFFENVGEVKLITYPSRTYWSKNINFKIIDSILKSKDLIIDNVDLNKNQKNELFNLLIDNSLEKKEDYAACYEPHHLFIFKDYKGKTIAFYEMCVSCGGDYPYGNFGKLPSFGVLKGEEFKKYFKKLKLKVIDEKSKSLKEKEKKFIEEILAINRSRY